MNQATDVFVIGGGPAGLASAIAARKRGFDVIVADGNKPPVDKPCGEGLMPDSVVALRQLGVEGVADEGIPFSGIRFADRDSSVAARFPIILMEPTPVNSIKEAVGFKPLSMACRNSVSNKTPIQPNTAARAASLTPPRSREQTASAARSMNSCGTKNWTPVTSSEPLATY